MFGMKSVLYVMVLLLLLFQGSFSMLSLKHHVKNVISRLSTAWKIRPIKCNGDYTIFVSLDSGNTTFVEGIWKDYGSISSLEVSAVDWGRCNVIDGKLTIRDSAVNGNPVHSTSPYPSLDEILGNVQIVTGDVEITGTPDLSSIVISLSKLSNIGRNLDIKRNSNLGSLVNAFPSLSKIRSLFISNNSNLGSMDNAFPELSKIGSLFISYNSNLGSMDNAFPKLSKIRSLFISNNSNLGSLDNAFPKLSEIGSLFILNNSNLRSMDNAFPCLLEIEISLQIFNNSNLGSMDNAFPKLSKIGSLFISKNSNLGSMDNAFPKLSKIVVRLDISNNPVLLSIEGSFNGILTAGVYEIKITNNGLIMFDNCFKNIIQPEPSLEFSQHNIPSLGPVSVMNKETRDSINVALIGAYWEFIQSKFSKYYTTTTTTTTSNPTELLTAMKDAGVVSEFFSHCFKNEFCWKDLFKRLEGSPLETLEQAGVLIEFLSACKDNLNILFELMQADPEYSNHMRQQGNKKR